MAKLKVSSLILSSWWLCSSFVHKLIFASEMARDRRNKQIAKSQVSIRSSKVSPRSAQYCHRGPLGGMETKQLPWLNIDLCSVTPDVTRNVPRSPFKRSLQFFRANICWMIKTNYSCFPNLLFRSNSKPAGANIFSIKAMGVRPRLANASSVETQAVCCATRSPQRNSCGWKWAKAKYRVESTLMTFTQKQHNFEFQHAGCK